MKIIDSVKAPWYKFIPRMVSACCPSAQQISEATHWMQIGKRTLYKDTIGCIDNETAPQQHRTLSFQNIEYQRVSSASRQNCIFQLSPRLATNRFHSCLHCRFIPEFHVQPKSSRGSVTWSPGARPSVERPAAEDPLMLHSQEYGG